MEDARQQSQAELGDPEAAIPPGGAGVDTRAGLVALVGRPNAGKSTLMNALIGEKLSIVTAREQTTRERVLGILTERSVQMVFVDTPGLLEPRYLLQQSMLEEALTAVEDADIVLLMLDPTRSDDPVPDPDLVEHLKARRDQVRVVVNKLDIAAPADVDRLRRWARSELGVDAMGIAAATGQGLDALREDLGASLPPSPFLYPEDDLAAQPVRFFVAELIRETIFEEYEQEVPYATGVAIEEFREAEEPVYIRAEIFVERGSQKGILIGKGGAAIKRLGSRSREKIEAFTGRRVYLDLWVKPLPGWRKKSEALKRLGYHVPQPNGGGS